MFSMMGLHSGTVKETIHVKNKAPYKEEPKEKEEEEKVECLPGEIGCPIPPEVEL